jgi:phospholipase/carboxylesterase
MSSSQTLDFIHSFVPGNSTRTLLLLHGTGGNEADLIPFGRALDSEAALLSPRGKVLEHGMPRFFRRIAEGVFDEEDLVRRTHELADFIQQAAVKYGFDPRQLTAVGYSNGANIASSLLLLRPGLLRAAALLRAMVPLIPEQPPDLSRVPILIIAGSQDPIIPAENTTRLAALLRGYGSEVTVQTENAGHNLTFNTIESTKRWLEERTK